MPKLVGHALCLEPLEEGLHALGLQTLLDPCLHRRGQRIGSSAHHKGPQSVRLVLRHGVPDVASHRVPEEMRGGDVENVEHGGDIAGHRGRVVGGRVVRLVALPVTASIQADHLVPLAQRLHIACVVPTLRSVRQAMMKNHRRTGTLMAVEHPNAVIDRVRHRHLPPCRRGAIGSWRDDCGPARRFRRRLGCCHGWQSVVMNSRVRSRCSPPARTWMPISVTPGRSYRASCSRASSSEPMMA